MSDTNNVSGNRAVGRKKSRFPSQQEVLTGASFDYFVNGVNYQITFENLLPALGATGTLNPSGNVLGTPILDIQGDVNNIRTVEDGPGIQSSVSPENGLALAHAFIAGNGSGTPVLIDETEANPIIRSLRAGSGIALGISGDSIQISATAAAASATILVNTLADLPTPDTGVIQLEDSTNYLFASRVDIGSNRLAMGSNTSITGTSLGNSAVISSTIGVLISFLQDTRGVVSEIAINAPASSALFDIESITPTTGTFNLFRIIVEAANTLGRFDQLAFLFAGSVAAPAGLTGNGAVFEGAFGLINIDSTFVNDWVGTLYDFGSCTFDFLNVENENLVSTSGANIVADGLPNSGNVNAGGSGIIRAVSLKGPFTPSTNIFPSDLQWNFTSNFGIPNSTNASYITMAINGTPTVVTDGVPTVILGTFTDERSSRFTNSAAGRATFDGVTNVVVQVEVTFSYSKGGSGTDTHNFYIAKNGTAIANTSKSVSTDTVSNPSVTLFAIVDLVATDYIEVMVEGSGTTDPVTVQSFSMVIRD